MVGAAHARNPVPLVNLENQAIAAASGKPLTLDDIKKALHQAGVIRGWTIEDVVPGKAVGTLMVRNKYTTRVDITYTETTISFKYKDSVNLDYGSAEDGKPVIHPSYMKWVNNLLHDLRLELSLF